MKTDTTKTEEQVECSSPQICWTKIYAGIITIVSTIPYWLETTMYVGWNYHFETDIEVIATGIILLMWAIAVNAMASGFPQSK